MMFGKVNVCQNSEKHVGNILHPFEHTAIQKSLFIARPLEVTVIWLGKLKELSDSFLILVINKEIWSIPLRMNN